MLDGFWSGVIGGLIGPHVIRFLQKFKFICIFGFIFVITPLAFFLLDAFESGWVIATHRILSEKLLGLLLGGGVLGAIAVFVVWASTAFMSGQRKEGDSE